MPHILNSPIVCTFAIATAVAVPALESATLTPSKPAQAGVTAPAATNEAAAADEMLGTQDLVSEAQAQPEAPLPVAAPPVLEEADQAVETRAAENAEGKPLQTLARNAYVTPTQADLGSPAAMDVPGLMAPFSEISDFTLGHTVPGSKWRLLPHFSVSGIFDDNIYVSNTHKVSDFYFAISPGLGALYGTEDSPLKIKADYTASALLFMRKSSQDTVDQNAVLHATYDLPKLSLGLTLAFQSLNGASIDVGDRVRRQIYYAGITTSYALSEKFSWDVNLDETVADYKGLYDSNESRIQTWLNYQATGKTNVGLGATFGYLDVQESPGQPYEQLQGRVNYNATGKLVLYASGGVELRQSDTNTVSPVFSVGGAYSPTATTTITLDVHERIYASAALEGQDYRATGGFITVTQQLRTNLSAFLTVGYDNADYFAVKDDIDADRTDHYVYTRVGPDWEVRRWFHLGAFYEFSRNASSGNGSDSFTRNRVGIQANFTF